VPGNRNLFVALDIRAPRNIGFITYKSERFRLGVGDELPPVNSLKGHWALIFVGSD
jgi:hypothetical protein